MDSSELLPGSTYAWGNPNRADRVVMVDTTTWRWHPNDCQPGRGRLVPLRHQRRVHPAAGRQTGINTGALVLRGRERTGRTPLSTYDLVVALVPILNLRPGVPFGGGLADDNSLLHALTGGVNGNKQTWLSDLLDRLDLYFDLVDPADLISPWHEWQAKRAVIEAAEDAQARVEQAAAEQRDRYLVELGLRLARHGISYSREVAAGDAHVVHYSATHVHMSYDALEALLTKVER